MADIFISYSSHDRLQALSLAERLRASGYDTWIDQHHIHGSARWGKEIVQAINSSSLVAVLISSSSLGSENVVKELSLAAERHKHLLPIMLEPIDLTEEFAYHLTGLNRVEIENTDSILKALEQLKIRTLSSGTDFSPSGRIEIRPIASKDIRLAILPFDDLSKEHDNEWFADGMLDELITTLGALEHMKVPSRTDVMYYKKHHPKAQEIASDLNVRYLVGGSVRKSGEKIRINASLTDAFTNQQLWTSNYDGTFDDIFELQERVSKQITETLKLRLTPEDKKKIKEQPTQNAEAYELYLRGLQLQRLQTRDSYEKAIELFEKAISKDGNFIEANLSIANICCAYYREYSREQKWLKQAEKNLAIVESLVGETSKTLWIIGEIQWLKGNYELAIKYLVRATNADPKFQSPFNILGNLYMIMGQYPEAVDAFQSFTYLEGSTIGYFNLLTALTKLDQIERLKNNAKKAIPVFEKYLEHSPGDFTAKIQYAFILFWAGNFSEAEYIANNMINEDGIDGLALYNLGCLFDEFGDPYKNVQFFKKAIKKGYREIEAFRNYTFRTENVECKIELQKIIAELEQIIEGEGSIG